MKMRSLAVLVAAMAILTSQVLAGNVGKIAGKVVDAKTKEPLVGVNVSLPGTSLGAITDVDGTYIILNVTPGKYSIKASEVGYDPVLVNGISVSSDFTTHQDFTLSETVLEQKEVVITAERPLVQKDLTASTAIIGTDQIASLPVTEVSQILELQAGFTGGTDHLRGGRAGEIAYWIDGVPVTDAYDGSEVVELNKSFIQEMQVISGAFNAEYGQAMSGIVNIATKEGSQKFAGTLSAYAGQYLSGDENQYDSTGALLATRYPGLSRLEPLTIQDIEGSLSGPVVGSALTFFVNGRYVYDGSYLNGVNRFNPWNIAYENDTSGQVVLYRDPDGKGDSSIVPMNWSKRTYAQGKLTWHASPSLKVSLNYINDYTVSDAYNYSYFLDPYGEGTNHDGSNTGILQITHTLSSSTFYTLGASVVQKDHDFYVFENPFDPDYVNTQVQNAISPYSFLTGGTNNTYYQRTSLNADLKLDVTSQVDKVNLVKAGFEYKQYRIYENDITLEPSLGQSAFNPETSSPFITTQILPESSIYHSEYTHRPLSLSAYLQDKLEFKDLIVNIGVRWDYFQPDANVLTDPTDPDIYDPLKPDNQFYDYNGDGIQESNEPSKTVAERMLYWYRPASAKSAISPRLGFSFPITAEGIVHFSYGHFFQIPDFQYLYQNPDYKIGTSTGDQGLMGNPDLQPEETINCELGVQQQLTEDISLDLTAYFRDIRNLTGTGQSTEIITFNPTIWYDQFANTDFGLVRGVVLTATKKFSSGFTATLDYTFQIANGTESDPTDARNAILAGTLPEIQTVPLSWDERHTLNLTASYSHKNWGISGIGKYGSGLPYTPLVLNNVTALLTNSESMPPDFNVDLRGFYEFPMAGLNVMAFVRLFNALNIFNQIGVFPMSGRADYNPQLLIDEQSNPALYVNTLQQYYTIPTYYSEPRRIEIGFNLEF
jgi:hypothetical protein